MTTTQTTMRLHPLSRKRSYDWFLGPKASEMLIADPTSPAARRLRKTASWMGRLNALLGLAIGALAALYVRGGI